MRFAIVENDIVTNVAEGLMPLEANWHEIQVDVPVAIGDKFDGQVFYDEEGNVRMSYVQNKTQIQVDKAHTQITDLESAFDSLMGGVSIALGL